MHRITSSIEPAQCSCEPDPAIASIVAIEINKRGGREAPVFSQPHCQRLAGENKCNDNCEKGDIHGDFVLSMSYLRGEVSAQLFSLRDEERVGNGII